MKRSWIIGALGAMALASAGCSGCALLDPTRGVATETLADEKALFGLEAAFYGANTAASVAVDNGLLKGGSLEAVHVADLLAESQRALNAARAAYAVGDAKTYTAKLLAAQSFVSAAWAAIPKEK